LFNQAIEAANPERSAFTLKRLGQGEESPEAHATNICQFSQVKQQAGVAFGNPSFAILLKRRRTPGIQTAGDKKYPLIQYLSSFNDQTTLVAWLRGHS
jgi:hypothetical protein